MARMKPTTRAFMFGLIAGVALLGITLFVGCAWRNSVDGTLQKLSNVGGFLSGLGIVIAGLTYASQIGENRRNRRSELQFRYLSILRHGVDYFGVIQKIPAGDSDLEKAEGDVIFMRGHALLVEMDIFLSEFLDTNLFNESYKSDLADTISRALDGTLNVLDSLGKGPFNPSPFVYISRFRKEYKS